MSTTTALSPRTAAIVVLDNSAKAYAAARAKVYERTDELEAELRALYRNKMKGIRSALAEAETAKAALVADVQEHRAFFDSPRTMTLHGIKFGLKKGAGKISWEDEDDVVVGRIDRLFKGDDDMLQQLIITTRKPSKDSLMALDVKDLAKLGIKVEGVADFVVVSDSASDARKLVKRILKEGSVHETDAAA